MCTTNLHTVEGIMLNPLTAFFKTAFFAIFLFMCMSTDMTECVKVHDSQFNYALGKFSYPIQYGLRPMLKMRSIKKVLKLGFGVCVVYTIYFCCISNLTH